MRSQKEDGEQQKGPQPDHTLEADQAGQDKRGLRSAILGLVAQPVLISVCVGAGEEEEMRWLGWEGWQGRGGEDLSCFCRTPPQSGPHKAGDGCGPEGPGMGSLVMGESCGKDRPRDCWTDFPVSSSASGPQSCKQAGGRKGRKPVASGY